ncbi:hypothetical protein ACWCPV_29550, partial [Streptomyces tubercidicus]
SRRLTDGFAGPPRHQARGEEEVGGTGRRSGTPARPTSPASPSATQPDRHRTADPSRSPVPGTDGDRPPRTTDTPTAQPSNRPDNSPSGATSPPSTPPSATPTLQDSDKSNKSNTPTAPAS